jgi:hypothetical protein
MDLEAKMVLLGRFRLRLKGGSLEQAGKQRSVPEESGTWCTRENVCSLAFLLVIQSRDGEALVSQSISLLLQGVRSRASFMSVALQFQPWAVHPLTMHHFSSWWQEWCLIPALAKYWFQKPLATSWLSNHFSDEWDSASSICVEQSQISVF